MRIGSIDHHLPLAVAALVVVVGLAVPVVSTPASDSTSGSATVSTAYPVDSPTASAPVPYGGSPVVTTPAPVPAGFDSEVEPPSSSTADTSAPERTSAVSTTTTTTTTSASAAIAGRPTAPAPVKPLAAQPAPIGSPIVSSGCPTAISGTTPGAPGRTSQLGVGGTTSADLQSFAVGFNGVRVANCLPPVPFANIRYDSCMEDRLFWMAEDPSTDPMSAWGHIGSVRSDGVPSVGCDGNLAGGTDNVGSVVAQKWWDSTSHRASLYKPTYTGGMGGVCIVFAMTHGGVPNEPLSFTRAAARWVTC